MNLQASEVASIKRQLIALTSRLEKAVQDQLDVDHRDGEIERGGNDRGDEANQALQISMDIEQTARSAGSLRQTREALAKLDTDEYGYSIECGGPINAKRLLVNPIAERCIDCQTDFEDDQDERDPSPSL